MTILLFGPWSVPSYELVPPAPSPVSECVLPLGRERGREATLVAGEGAGGANWDDWRESLALCILSDLTPVVLLPENLRAHLQLSV